MVANQLIVKCEKKILSGKKITDKDAKMLFNVPPHSLQKLCNSANTITRKFNGRKVDVEQLSNIKKNYCSEDCAFCSQSAFFNTNIGNYQLPPPEKIVEEARKAFDEGANSYCLVAAWREPSEPDFQKSL